MDLLIQVKKHFSKMGWCYFAVSLLICVVQLILVRVVDLVAPQVSENINGQLLLSVISMYVVSFPILAVILKRFVPAQKIEKKKMSAGKYVVAAIMCLGLAYVTNLAGNLMTIIIGMLKGSPVDNTMLELTADLSPWVILLYMVIAAPILEEIFFRKMIVERTAKYGDWAAILTSGLMFGLFHGNLNQFVYATAIGMFFAYLYVKTGNLKITISLHMLFNFIGGFLSTLILRSIDIQAYMDAAATGNVDNIMKTIGDHLPGWICYGVLIVFVCCMILASIVLFIVMAALRKFKFERGEIDIPWKLRYSILYANLGMLAFGVFWMIMILRQLLA